MTVRPPAEIRLDRITYGLVIEWGDGRITHLSAEYLRVESPSAEVRGHGATPPRLVHGCRDVAISQIEPVGNYAIRLGFDDGHETGIYSWDYLDQLDRGHAVRWSAYVAALEQQGLSRDPAAAPRG